MCLKCWWYNLGIVYTCNCLVDAAYDETLVRLATDSRLWPASYRIKLQLTADAKSTFWRNSQTKQILIYIVVVVVVVVVVMVVVVTVTRRALPARVSTRSFHGWCSVKRWVEKAQACSGKPLQGWDPPYVWRFRYTYGYRPMRPDIRHSSLYHQSG